jgi:serine/threonine-protein kinase
MTLVGAKISHYKIVEKIGEGGMGVVYKAEDTKLGRPVALKFLASHALGEGEHRERLVREAKAAAMLSHPSICTVYEIDEAGGDTFIAMEFLDGQSLKEILETGPMGPAQAVHVAIQIADGLKEAHSKGIVHRDIKPANIVLTSGGHAKITDFGIAKSAGFSKLTKTGTSLGTVAYMSPEQGKGGDVDGRSDIWSLGVVLYEMLTGRVPFEADYEQAVLYKVMNEDPPPVEGLIARVPAGLKAVIERALKKDSSERYQSPGELVSDLKEVKARGPSGAPAPDAARGDDIPSIAVLPFANLSSDPENEYFGDGLAEELINSLARIEGLRVAARTSAFRFRGKEEDIREIGPQLNVTHVLEGSVRRSGNRIRVTAQLINVDDGYHLWSERYDREFADIFAIQDEITDAIVRQLEVKLLTRSGDPIVKRYTDDLDAYSLYLKGRYYWHSLTAEGWAKCKDMFEKAIELDPNFAGAYVWLAIHSASQAFWGDLPPRQAFAGAKGLAKKALELDPNLPEAYDLMGVYSTFYDWDWKAGEAAYKRAIEIEPGVEGMFYVNYALSLAANGRPEEALGMGELAVKLDPLSPVIASWVGALPCYVGRAGDSVRKLEEAVALDPDYWQSHYFLGYAHLYGEDFENAIISAQEAVDLSGGAQTAMMVLACARYLNGDRSEGDKLYGQLLERSRRGYVHSSLFAALHWARGEPDESLKWTKKAIEERDVWLGFHKVDPPCIRLTDPRIVSALREVGL